MSGWLVGQTYLSEDFSGNQMPPTGWTIDGYAAQWSVAGSTNAGGSAPEAMFTYIQTISTTRFVSPEIDMTGVNSVKLVFNHMYDWYANPAPVVGVATRSGGGDWNSVWEITPTGNVGPQTVILDLTDGDLGQSDFQFCFYIDGNFYNLDYWYLDDILLYNPYNTDAQLSSIHLPPYVQVGDQATLTGKVKNVGLDNITSFDVSYSIDGGSGVVYSVSGLNLALGASYNFTHNVPLVFNTTGTFTIDVTVENVNGGNDDNPANNMLSTYVSAVEQLMPKKVFAEEATGTWCGYCVRGVCFMDYMYETYPDTWIGVTVHNGDPMVYAPWDAAIPSIIPNFPGYPSGTIDRAGANYFDPSEFEQGYLQRIEAISPASVDIVNYTWDPVTRVVSFDVQSEFIADVNNELRFAAVIVEDSLWGTSSQWNQANYYSGGSLGPMCGFENLSNPIPATDMHYDHVGRVILDTPYGTVGSLPTPVVSGNTYSHNYTYTIPNNWNYDKLTFVGLLIDMSTGEILNANNVVNFATGINKHNPGQEVSVYPNPTRGKVNISGAKNATIAVYTITGNQVAVYKDFQSDAIDLSNLDNGIYFLNVIVDDQTVINKKINLVK
jgi:hypothetical protein